MRGMRSAYRILEIILKLILRKCVEKLWAGCVGLHEKIAVNSGTRNFPQQTATGPYPELDASTPPLSSLFP
jgi:hypothetical protein